MTRLAVFDCDGTLVDSQATILAAMGRAFSEHGLPSPSAESVRRVVGLPLVEAIAQVAGERDSGRLESLRAAYARIFFDLHRTGAVEPLYPGVVAALDALEADGWLLGIATGKARRGLEATLAPHGLGGRFVTRQTSDVAAGKPSPDMLLRAMAETGAAPTRTVMIGDTTYDMRMARNADAWAVGVGWGYHGVDELRGAGAHMTVDRFQDLPELLGTLMEAE